MKTFKTSSLFLFLIPLLIVLSSCKKESSDTTFLIKVDSIQVPGNINANESFGIKLYGTIGSSGCYHFSHFTTEKQGNNILIEAWGKSDTNSGICPAVMVYLDHEITFLIKDKGVYTIKIKQPEGDDLEQQIYVE